MKMGGITRRWFRNTFLVTGVIVLLVAVLIISMLYAQYYGSVEAKLESKAWDLPTVYSFLFSGANQNTFISSGRTYLENFEEKDKIGVWIIDNTGNVLLSSSGFEHSEKRVMPDFKEAMSSKDGMSSVQITVLPESEEKVMVTTVVLQQSNVQIGAIRFIISLEEVDAQLWVISLFVVLGAMIAMLFVLLSGFSFTRPIVQSITQINETAGKIAHGDMDARIDHYYYDDELGQLCMTINHMAERLQESDQIKNDFISTVSHELRTPMTSIKGWGETLLQIGTLDEGTAQRGLNIIISESMRLSGMLDELLDFSKMQSGRLQMKTDRIDVLAELDDTVFAMRERATREGIDLRYHVPDTPIPMQGDADRIRQVFVNIIDNAIKYNRPGGKITIGASIRGNTMLEITVEDTGIGISSEALPRVKEKFYKRDFSVRGSGIGLAVADEIVKMHGGELYIDSELNKGTRVTILFPMQQLILPNEAALQEEGTIHEQTE